MGIFETRFLPDLKGREGGARYTNNPADRGGPTRWGVTAATLGEWRRLGRAATPDEVRNLPEAEADALYTAKYWLDPGYASIADISPSIAEELLDTGVNMGTGVPGRWLQRALNGLNRQGRDYPDIKVDNDIGGATRAALRGLIAARGQRAAERAVLRLLNGLQAARYLELCEGRQPNEQFLFGWLENRVA